MSDVDKLAEQIVERLKPHLRPSNLEHDTGGDRRTMIHIDDLKKALQEAPIQIIHHSPKDAATCPNCKPELDDMLNEAREQGRRIGRLTGKQELMAR